jgi:uncharacterized protein (TIGR02271 family)
MESQWQPIEGMDVFGADGDKLGKIVAISSSSIVVEKGFFFPKDYYIPRSAIANIDGDSVYLTVGKDEALNSGWDQDALAQSEGYTTDMSGAGGTAIPTTGGDAWLGTAARADYAAGMASEEDSALGTGSASRSYDANRVSREATEDTMRIPVHEEELTATKRPVEYGDVRIEKDVIEEPRSLEVPVTEERVRVTRRTVDREADGSLAFEEDSLHVPVRGEEVDVQKRTRVAEEVEIAKERVQKNVRADDTVRREVVDVVDETGRAAESGRSQTRRRDEGLVDKAKDALNLDDPTVGESSQSTS